MQTFVSTNRGTIGKAYYGKILYSYCRPTATPRRASSRSSDGLTVLPRVDIVYAHENADGTFVKAAVAAGAKGIVLAGVGDGNGTTDLVNALAEAAKEGVVVVRARAWARHRAPQHRAGRRQARLRRRDGHEPAEGARPAARSR